jgi:hypothetical protein
MGRDCIGPSLEGCNVGSVWDVADHASYLDPNLETADSEIYSFLLEHRLIYQILPVLAPRF